MLSSIPRLAALALYAHVAHAEAADVEKAVTRTSQDQRSCDGVNNENTKMRELKRELGAYFGQPIPEDLQLRVRKHVELVARLKAECDHQREQSALAK